MTTKTNNFEPSQLYYYIKWNELINKDDVNITYHSEARWMDVTINYNLWIPPEEGGRVPWNKIKKIHYNDKTLWNRNTNVYNLVDIKQNLTSNIDLLYFNQSKGVWQVSKSVTDTPTIKESTISKIMNVFKKQTGNISNYVIGIGIGKLITSNGIYIMSYDMDCNQYMKTYNSNLIDELFKYLFERINTLEMRMPDVICFQGVNPEMKKDIMANSMVRQHFYISGNDILGTGQITLSRFRPVAQNQFKSNNSTKKFIQFVFENDDGSFVEVYNVRLTGSNTRTTQTEQMYELNSIINPYNKYIIAGYFNTEYDLYMEKAFNMWNYWNLSRYYHNLLLYGKLKQSAVYAYGFTPSTAAYEYKIINDNTNKELKDKYGLYLSLRQINHNQFENCHHQISDTPNTVQLVGDTYLCSVIDAKYWDIINKYRLLYSDTIKIATPHIKLFRQFLEPHMWNLNKHHIQLILRKYSNTTVVFDKVSICEHKGYKFIVITPKIKTDIMKLYENICYLLNTTKSIFRPYITVGSFPLNSRIEHIIYDMSVDLIKNPIKVSLCNLTYMVNRNDICEPVETIYACDIDNNVYSKLNPIEYVVQIVNMCLSIYLEDKKQYNIEIIDSMFCEPISGTVNILVTGSMEHNNFNELLIKILKMSPNVNSCLQLTTYTFPYVAVNIYDNKKFNIIYKCRESKSKDEEFNRQIIKHSNMVTSHINVLKCIYDYITKYIEFVYLELFARNYREIKKLFIDMNIYGSNYGYFDDNVLLIMALKVFIENDMNKWSTNSSYVFILKFLEKYSKWDWKTPISMHSDNEIQSFVKKYPSDFVACVLIVSEKSIKNLVSHTSPHLLKNIKMGLEYGFHVLKDINEKQYGTDINIKPTINYPLFTIDITEYIKKDAVNKSIELSEKIWKLFLSLEDVYPDIGWKSEQYMNKHRMVYRIGFEFNKNTQTYIDTVRDYLYQNGIAYQYLSTNL
jgi:hypothetical protein